MTDEMTPDEEARVRRLLAESSGPLVMPADVSARLDDVITGLVASRDGDDAGPGGVTPLPVAKRRRWPKVLVAAAAVSLLGYVGAGLLGSGMQGSTDSAAGGRSAEAGSSTDQNANPDRARIPAAGPSARLPASGDEPRTRARLLARALTRLNAQRETSPTSPDGVPSALSLLPQADSKAGPVACKIPRLDKGDVSYLVGTPDGTQRTLVIRAAPRRADLYACDQPYFPEASTPLPATP